MCESHCDAHVVTMLDSIAWLYNIRGRDVAYNPVVISYAIVTHDSAKLFVDQSRLEPEHSAALAKEGITIVEYGGFCPGIA
jgi:Xaa-Pro aminopeptidase